MNSTLATIAALCVAACTGARTNVVAARAEYPVSMSRAIRDADGNLVPAERRKVVGTFHTQRTAWSVAWRLVNLSKTTDISDEINRQVAEAHGDAIIHLTIVTKHCTLSYFSFPLGALPIWPSCSDLDVFGDIVKVEPVKAVSP
jgi:hypothetical protein